jgi:ataxin-10
VKTPSGEVRQLSTPTPLPNGGLNASNAATAPVTSAERSADSDSSKGFNYLKRDIVRLLGILCFERKAAQDRIRVCGGIPVIMNLCALDERNPCE